MLNNVVMDLLFQEEVQIANSHNVQKQLRLMKKKQQLKMKTLIIMMINHKLKKTLLKLLKLKKKQLKQLKPKITPTLMHNSMMEV